MKRLTKEQLREQRNVFNSHNFCSFGGGNVYVSYRARESGRGCRVPGFLVVGIGFHTNPQAHFLDNGCQFFSAGQMDKAARLEEAKRWSGERYGITEWVRDPFGGWQDAQVYARVMTGAVD